MCLHSAEVTGFNPGTMKSIFDSSTRLGAMGIRSNNVMAVAAAAASVLPAQGSIAGCVLLSHHRHYSGAL